MARLLFVEDHPELASLMVAAAQSRGHEATAVHTGEAALALLRPAAFHAAVVDLLLPDMRGSAVLSALRDHAIPAIAVSGVFKGDRFAREATEVHGARAFFEKPFELRQLLEAVEQLCDLTRPLPPPASAGDEEEVVVFEDASLLDDEPVFTSSDSRDEPVFASSDSEDEPVFAPPPEEQPPVVMGLVLVEEAAESPKREDTPPSAEDRLTPTISTSDLEELGLLDALDDEDGSGPAPRAQAEKAPVAASEEAPVASEPAPGLALPFGEREKVWAKTAAPSTRRRPLPEWTLSGDLKNTSVPRLLNAYYESRHSGELKLRQGSLLKVAYFEAGRPVYAASNLAHERFARFCVRRGVLPEAKLQEVLTLAREQNLRSGEVMIRQGLLDAARRQQLVEEQVKEILWSTFSWTEGAYGFSPIRPPRTGLVKLSIFPGDLILEGTLKTEPLVALRRHLPLSRRLFPSAAPPYGLHELKLQGQQALLLAYADGSKTVEDLLALTELPERDVLATLRGLELIGVLEERRDEPSPRSRISFAL
jgi:CheY-like chemotaxis protein